MPFRSSSTTIPSVKNSNKTTPPSTIRLKGWLNKQKHGKCRAWLRRYFVLYGEELRYYKNKVKKIINLYSCQNILILIFFFFSLDGYKCISSNFT